MVLTVLNMLGLFDWYSVSIFRYAGVLTGMTGTMANIAAMLAPIITFQLTKNVMKICLNSYYICTIRKKLLVSIKVCFERHKIINFNFLLLL